MLTVQDDGVKIGLQSAGNRQPAWNRWRYQWTWLGMAIVLALLGAANGLGWLSGKQTGIAMIVVVAVTAVVNWLARRGLANASNPSVPLSGGFLHVTKGALHHTDDAGRITPITLADTDCVQIDGDTLHICQADGTTRCRIGGFAAVQHINVAKSVLQGQTIRTQTKAIRLQDK